MPGQKTDPEDDNTPGENNPAPAPEPPVTPPSPSVGVAIKKGTTTMDKAITFRCTQQDYDRFMAVVNYRIESGKSSDLRHCFIQAFTHIRNNNFISGFPGITKWDIKK